MWWIKRAHPVVLVMRPSRVIIASDWHCIDGFLLPPVTVDSEAGAIKQG